MAKIAPSPKLGLPGEQAFHARSCTWADVLLEQADAQGLTKAQRTLLRLKAGTAQALAEVPYPALKIADIVKRAGLSYGLFYHYFKDKEQAVKDVLLGYVEHSETLYRSIHITGDEYESMFDPNLFYIENYARNAGLMSAWLTLSESDAAFGDVWNNIVDSWHRRMANGVRAARSANPSFQPEPDFVAYSLGGMIDQICRQIFIQNNPFVGRFATNTLQLAESLSIIWYRVVHGHDPKEEQVKACHAKYTQQAV